MSHEQYPGANQPESAEPTLVGDNLSEVVANLPGFSQELGRARMASILAERHVSANPSEAELEALQVANQKLDNLEWIDQHNHGNSRP